MLQSSDCLCGRSLDSLQYVYVYLALVRPELATVLQMGPTKSDVLARLFLMKPRMLLVTFAVRAHCWLVFKFLSTRTPSTKLLSTRSPAYTGSWSYSSPGAGVVSPSVELHEVPFSSFLQPVEVPLKGSTPIWCTRPSSQFRIICKYAKGALYSIIQIINEEVKQYWPQYWPLSTPLAISLQLDFVSLITSLWAWQCNRFSVRLTVHLSAPCLIILSMRILSTYPPGYFLCLRL